MRFSFHKKPILSLNYMQNKNQNKILVSMCMENLMILTIFTKHGPEHIRIFDFK